MSSTFKTSTLCQNQQHNAQLGWPKEKKRTMFVLIKTYQNTLMPSHIEKHQYHSYMYIYNKIYFLKIELAQALKHNIIINCVTVFASKIKSVHKSDFGKK